MRTRRRLVRLLIAGAFVFAIAPGCGDGGMTDPQRAPVASVTLSAPAGQPVPGDEVQLVASLQDASGAELTDREIVWSSSDEAVASVSQTGLVTAVSAGTATITATSEQRSGTLELSIQEGARIGTEGGTVAGFSGAIRLEVPPGALESPVSITVARATALPRDPSIVLGSGYVLGPAGTAFAAPAALTLAYEPEQGPSGVAEADLRIHHFEAGPPQVLEGTVDPSAHTASVGVSRLGAFAVRRLAATEPCTDPEYRQFDFWVGQWTVEVAGLPSGAPRPPSDITLEPGGCAVFENFANGAGLSLNVFSPETGNWHQTFIFSNGSRQVLIGGLQGSEMILTGRALGPPGSFDRWTWTPLSGGRVRQLQEQSNDGGQTVQPFFDGTYVPR